MEFAPMSPFGMFLYAGPVSKVVMALLLAAAAWTWVLIIDGVFVLVRLSKALDRARAGGDIGVLWPIAEAAQEASHAELPDEPPHLKRERVLQQMNRAAGEFMLDAEGGLPVLAIVASAGPFVGLFGTVWGIMSSFSGIAQTQDTSLAVVAPGIADALAATAYGLAAAIPAAIGYNRMGMAFGDLREKLSRYVLSLANSIA
ncbi:MAG: flagellar motor protein MotA [Alphaproteobacteria bacterium]|nr:flagellar motor protein MotA [Alphaproteobacteria bacterium]MBM3652122.1 flagellar motor protein MotA [Alphaproteobacteria bacterium]